jgi:cytidylate kinase
MAVITISRQAGSGGDEVATHLADKLQFHLVRRAYLEKAIYEYCLLKTIKQLPLPEIIPPAVDKPGARVAHRHLLRTVLMNLAAGENLVIVGYGSQVVFRSFRTAFHVRIVAPFDDRVKKIMAAHGLGRKEATEHVRNKDMERRSFLKEFFGVEIGKQHYYDLILNLNRLSEPRGADVVASAFRAAVDQDADPLEEYRHHIRVHRLESMDLIPNRGREEEPSAKAAFAHPSEEEFASVLNFYRIKWEYEPRTFPIQWDEQGVITESFTPDFYLPEFDSYIELTTMKQELVTKKNRKIRRLRELYPGINLKVFYGRDYKQLLGKYGLD